MRFEGAARPPPEVLYWRGPVLGRFDGVEWSRIDAAAAAAGGPRRAAQLRVSGVPLGYEMTLEPNRLPVLPLLEATPNTEADAPRIDNQRAYMRGDLQWATDQPVTDYETAKRSDTKRFAAFFHHMLENGVYLAPSQFEAGFVGAAHSEADIAATVATAMEFFK